MDTKSESSVSFPLLKIPDSSPSTNTTTQRCRGEILISSPSMGRPLSLSIQLELHLKPTQQPLGFVSGMFSQRSGHSTVLKSRKLLHKLWKSLISMGRNG